MSEQENITPSKPKVGSLRDKIAAFEKSAQNDNTPVHKPLPPRAKPGAVSWKPAPSSPKNDGDDPAINEKKYSGMSADDAKESIAAGGGLKARMAALQGNMNHVGGSPAAPPPIPKPLRKPFVPRSPTPDEDGQEELENKEKAKEPLDLSRRRLDNWDPLATALSAGNARQNWTTHNHERVSEPAAEEQTPEQAQEEQAQDEDIKERERRAALAARMARLGGARIGMAPPVVPKKPNTLVPTEDENHIMANNNHPTLVRVLPTPERRVTEDKVQTPVEVKETGSDTMRTITAGDEATSRAAVLPPTSPVTSAGLSEKRSSSFHEDASSSQTSLASSGSHPGSIPLPVMPRRAAPPRSKHSSRSVKLEESSQEPDSPETTTQNAAGIEVKDVTQSRTEQTADAVLNVLITEDYATSQKEEHGESYEESNKLGQDQVSHYENETKDTEHNFDHEEQGAEEERKVEEEVEVKEKNSLELREAEEGNEDAEASDSYIPREGQGQGQDEIETERNYEEEEGGEEAPSPPPRRQQGSRSTINSSEANENTVIATPNDSKHFFQDAADELEDS